MNIYLINEYVNRLKVSDITYYAEKQGITLDKDEAKLIYDYIKNISDINIKTFSTTKDLFKLNKKDVFIILDKNKFDKQLFRLL